MANKKKKKPAANPARGFATTSMPSKVKSTHDDDSTTKISEEQTLPHRGSENTDTVDLKSRPPTSADPDTNSMTAEQYEAHLEKVWFENIVAANAIRVKSDAARQVTKLQNEWRLLRLNAENPVVPELTEDILDKILEDDATLFSRRAKIPADSKTTAENDDQKHLLSLWLLYNILTTLKMPAIDEVLEWVAPQLINNTLEADDSVTGLTACFKWYAAYSVPEELPNYQIGKVADTNLEDELEENTPGESC